MTNEASSPIPELAENPVYCDSARTTKHHPKTKEAIFKGSHVKYKVCKDCGKGLR